MTESTFFASPWWVNLLFAVPFVAYVVWRRRGGLWLSRYTLLISAVFGAAFGFVEAAVVVYLRAAAGFPPGSTADPVDLANGAPLQILIKLSQELISVEVMREVATIVMLLAVAFLAARELRNQVAAFLWTFAFWDIFYYVGLYAAVGWPPLLLTPDVLFLIPVPWIAQVWFPLAVSALTAAAVLLARRKDLVAPRL